MDHGVEGRDIGFTVTGVGHRRPETVGVVMRPTRYLPLPDEAGRGLACGRITTHDQVGLGFEQHDWHTEICPNERWLRRVDVGEWSGELCAAVDEVAVVNPSRLRPESVD